MHSCSSNPRVPGTDSASFDSVTHRWCRTAMFTVEKHPSLSGSVKFKLIVQGLTLYRNSYKYMFKVLKKIKRNGCLKGGNWGDLFIREILLLLGVLFILTI